MSAINEIAILFVEDELDKQVKYDPFYRILDDQGWQVDVAVTGAAAWRKLMATSYHLIILDNFLPPGVDGEEIPEQLQNCSKLEMGLRLLQGIRDGIFAAQGTVETVPVVVVSGVSDNKVWNELKQQIDEPLLLSKPISRDALVAAVKHALGLRTERS